MIRQIRVTSRVDPLLPASAFSMRRGWDPQILPEHPTLQSRAACCRKVSLVPVRLWLSKRLKKKKMHSNVYIHPNPLYGKKLTFALCLKCRPVGPIRGSNPRVGVVFSRINGP